MNTTMTQIPQTNVKQTLQLKLKELKKLHSMNELREMAKNTRDTEIQNILKERNDIELRINLSLNPYLSTEIANFLVDDSTVNVSFRAIKNKNCTRTKSFNPNDSIHRCIVCELDTHFNKCKSCN